MSLAITLILTIAFVAILFFLDHRLSQRNKDGEEK
nr:MAG TPA: hypothetical protein [Caudoviricetes sp.]